MTFLNPLAFLALLAVPLLILLYFLKLKRPYVEVPSTLLWQKVIQDLRVNSPFQRLRRSLLLLLQLLALLALIVALARPLLRVRENANQSLIVLLDTSASMAATEPDGARLELARAEIRQLVDGLGRDDEMMLATFNAKASVVCGFTANRQQLRDALAGVRPTDSSTAFQPALLLAKSIAASRARPRVVVFSDGAFAAPPDVELTAPIEYRKVGIPARNVAVTGLDVRRSIRDRNTIEMFVALENFSAEPAAGTMTVSLNQAPLDSKYVSIGPRETLSQIFEAVLPRGGDIQVQLDIPDALACDNRAWKVVPPPRLRRILIVGDSTYFVERAFKASQAVQFKTVTPARYTSGLAADCTAVVWCSVPSPGIAPCQNLYLGCAPGIEGVRVTGTLDGPEIADWENTHPVNRFLDYDNLSIGSTLKLTLPDDATVLVRSSRTPLIALLEHESRGMCLIGFNPMDSNWPLLLSFPLFLNGCLDYFETREENRIEKNILVGRSINVPGPYSDVKVRTPSGESHPLHRMAEGLYGFAGVDLCGIYTVEAPDLPAFSVAANLFDRRESSLEPADALTIGSKVVKSADPGHRLVNSEYWKPLLALVGVVLVLEWAVYHRRWGV